MVGSDIVVFINTIWKISSRERSIVYMSSKITLCRISYGSMQTTRINNIVGTQVLSSTQRKAGVFSDSCFNGHKSIRCSNIENNFSRICTTMVGCMRHIVWWIRTKLDIRFFHTIICIDGKTNSKLGGSPNIGECTNGISASSSINKECFSYDTSANSSGKSNQRQNYKKSSTHVF